MSVRSPLDTAGLTSVDTPDYPAGSTVLTVGVDKQFQTVADAVAAARDGYVILVDAGTYTNDFPTIRAKLTIIGVGGMVNMVATVPPPNLKAIMTVDNDLTLKNFSFTGAAVPLEDGGNGAGIRYEAGRMVLVNDSFIGNQNGILGGPGTPGFDSDIVIDHSLFADNGSGTGQTHNLYIGAVNSLTVTNSVFEGAVVGHELKSRAMVNTIDGNVFMNGPTGTASYDIDLPNGGTDVVTNNLIEKGPMAQNTSMVHFGGEGLPYLGSSLLLEGNTFVNDLNGNTIAVLNQSGLNVTITGNEFDNIADGQVARGPATISDNVTGTGAAMADSTNTATVPGTNSVTFTDADPHSVTLTDDLKGVQGGAGLLTVTAVASQVVVAGGSGGVDYTETGGSANNKVSTLAGSTNTLNIQAGGLVDSNGTDTISTGDYASTIGRISGNATVSTGNQYDQWTVSGTATITSHDMGFPTVAVTATGNATISGPLNGFHLQNNGGTATVDAMLPDGTGASSHYGLTLQGGSASVDSQLGYLSVTTAFGTQGATINLTDGAAQVISNGSDIVWAGAGDDTVIVRGHTEIHAGTGNLTVYGNGTTANVYGGTGTVVLGGNSGGLTYYGGDSANTVQSDLSRDTLIGGAGHMTITGTGYVETVIGGSGGISYSMPAGSATVTTAAGSVNDILLNIGSVDSWGQDTITFTTNDVAATVHGDSTINGSTGLDTLTLSGHDTLNGHGRDVVTVTSGADVVLHFAQSGVVNATAAKMRLSLGSGASATTATVNGTAYAQASQAEGMMIRTADQAATSVGLGSGPITVRSYGADTVHGGSGDDTVYVNAGNAQIWGGSGSMSIHNEDFKVGDTLNIHGGTGSMSIINIGDRINYYGGSGDTFLNAYNGAVNLVGGSGNLTSIGGAGGLRFLGGTGTASLTLSSSANDVIFGQGTTTVQAEQWGRGTLFEFMAGHGGGTDIINGFNLGLDHLVLTGVSVQTQTTNGAGTSLLLTDGTNVQLNGVTDTTRLFA